MIAKQKNRTLSTQFKTDSLNLTPNIAWSDNVREIIKALNSDEKEGLTHRQATERLKILGPNKETIIQDQSISLLCFHELKNPQTILLISAAILSKWSNAKENDANFILSALIANSLIAITTAWGSSKILQSALKNDDSDPNAIVRSGKVNLYPRETIVPGDIVYIEKGIIPADMRILTAQRLLVDEALLTGESNPIEKYPQTQSQMWLPLAARKMMIYRGTIIVSGHAKAIVTATGDQTEIGIINQIVRSHRAPKGMLQLEMDHLGTTVSEMIVFLSILVFLLGYLRGQPFIELFRFTISLAVSAIPESLPTIATTTLAITQTRINSERLIIRHLDTILNLAHIDILCIDKTGTITQNDMYLRFISVNHQMIARDKFTPSAASYNTRLILFLTLSLCIESDHPDLDIDNEQMISPTEKAILSFSKECSNIKGRIDQKYQKIWTQYRTQQKSYITTCHRHHSSKRFIYVTKGNPKQVLKKCQFIYEKNRVRTMKKSDRDRILMHNDQMAKKGTRVLGVAYRFYPDCISKKTKLQDLIWLCLIGLEDPIRQGIKDHLSALKNLGIRILMLTGDQKPTALYVASQIGINHHTTDQTSKVAKSLKDLSSNELKKTLCECNVFYRVSPDEKLLITKTLQDMKYKVAMLGDGLNDTPALRAADVGIAVKTNIPSSVTRYADIMVDQSAIESIETIIQTARQTKINLRSAINYIITTNLSEMLLTISSLVFEGKTALATKHLLWINVITDILPGISIALSNRENSFYRNEHLSTQTGNMPYIEIDKTVLFALTFTIHAQLIYSLILRQYRSHKFAQRSVFSCLALSQLIYAISMATNHKLLLGKKTIPKIHPLLLIACFLGITFLIFAIKSDAKKERSHTPDQNLSKPSVIGQTLLSLVSAISTTLANELIAKYIMKREEKRSKYV